MKNIKGLGMKKIIFCLILLQSASISYAGKAEAGELSVNYLKGSWALDSKKQCNVTDKEYFIFRANGTFENGRAGKVEATGFWHIDDYIVQLHMVTSPGFYANVNEQMKEFQDLFVYVPARLVTTDIQPDRFDGVGVLGQEIKKATFFRCK